MDGSSLLILDFLESQKYDENQGPGSKVPRKSEVSPSPARQPHG